jgi:hypothetical protein
MKSSKFSVSLGYIVRSGYLKNDGVSVDLSAAKASLRTLPNSDGWFEEICASVHTRKWLEQKIERIGLLRLRVYLIVGLHTFQNVKFTSRKKGDMDVRVADEAKAPITALVMAGSQLGGVIDPALSSTFDNAHQMLQSFSKDELIYAVQYRRLKFNWFSSKDLDKSYLDRKTFWKVMVTDCGRAEGEGSEEDEYEEVLEAQLCDDSDSDEGGNHEGKIDLVSEYGNVLRYRALKRKD